jgi:exonuclease VII small subunit
MTAQEEQLARLLNQKAEEVHEADARLLQSISRLESAMNSYHRATLEPEKVYEFLEDAEAHVEQLTRSLYSAMDVHLTACRGSNGSNWKQNEAATYSASGHGR